MHRYFTKTIAVLSLRWGTYYWATNFKPHWQDGRNVSLERFHILLDYTLGIYKRRCEEMGTDLLSIENVIPYVSANSWQSICFPF